MAETRTWRGWPVHGWIGLALIAVFWPLNWSSPEEWEPTHWGFFPLWLGYSLSVDALVWRRKGTSLLTRSPPAYVGLFLLSAPAWWLFEIFNHRAENWYYLGGAPLLSLEGGLFASLSFSTVMPAVFGTAELASTFSWIRKMGRGPRLAPSAKTLAAMFALGWLMLALLLVWPKYFFPCLWLSIYFVLDPINAWLGKRSLLDDTQHGDWRGVVALAVGCLICGFFWEFWNYHSYPKWKYQVPFFDFLRIFEMPLLGYGGYVPFAWELFALFNLVAGRPGGSQAGQYVQVRPDEGLPLNAPIAA